MAVKVGDEVLYIPDICHAKNRDISGVFAWSFGWRDERTGVVGPVLTDDDVADKIKYMYRKGPKRANLPGENKAQNLVPLAPKVKWPALVTAVNSDGTCNLDIDHCLQGVTLHYERIAQDRAGNTPNTWQTEGA